MAAPSRTQRDSWMKQILCVFRGREGFTSIHEGQIKAICFHSKTRSTEIREIKDYIKESPSATPDEIIKYAQTVVRAAHGCGSCIGLITAEE